MLLELIAAVVAGLGAGGLAALARRLTGGAVPGFTIPAAAALAMLLVAVWNEYAWYPRLRAALPPGFEVIAAPKDPSPWRPWTYARPYVSRFAAVDKAGARRNAAAPGQLLTEIRLFARYAPPARVPVVVDCLKARRADLLDGAAALDAEGRVVETRWRALAADDLLLSALCPTP